MHHVTGTFAPKITPVATPDLPEAPALGRMTIAKTLHGGLEATGTGEMLSLLDRTTMSGSYVALEIITGTLDGRSGSFALVHTGHMDHGKPGLTVTVVPGSGTGELAGLAGTFTIAIAADGKHSYTFDYTLPPHP